MITDEHIDFSLASAIIHFFFFFLYQVCPIKQDKTVGGLGSEEEEEGGGDGRCRVTVKRERKRGMTRAYEPLMHSLCAGRVLLQNTHSHKHISTLRAHFAPVKGHLADRVLTSITAAHS